MGNGRILQGSLEFLSANCRHVLHDALLLVFLFFFVFLAGERIIRLGLADACTWLLKQEAGVGRKSARCIMDPMTLRRRLDLMFSQA